jgi:hypothetical protein
VQVQRLAAPTIRGYRCELEDFALYVSRAPNISPPTDVNAIIALLSACGSSPSPTTPTPTSTTFQLTGIVRGNGGTALAGATVRILDGPNQNQTAMTDTTGRYTFAALRSSGFTLQVSANEVECRDRAGGTALDASIRPEQSAA